MVLPESLMRLPVFLMLQIMRIGRRAAEQSPEGPRLPLIMVLACLHEFGPHSQRQLCDRLDIDPSDMVAWVDQLEAEGLARRERDQADRRRNQVAITPAGTTYLQDKLAAAHERMATKLLAALDDDEREALVNLLQRALAGIEERVPDHYRQERVH